MAMTVSSNWDEKDKLSIANRRVHVYKRISLGSGGCTIKIVCLMLVL